MTPALGLYVHWPYCARICPYCDFNVYRARGQDDALVEAICADLLHWRELTGERKLASIHFGGGTPSLMTAAQIDPIIRAADRLWGFVPGIEIGLEANPNDCANFSDLASAGVNRMSLGVQSFDGAALKMLGRDHDAASARKAIDAAQSAFNRVSFDMIYALEGQGVEIWRTELAEALAYNTEHLSLYQLTIEPGTAFAKRVARGDMAAPDGDIGADLYSLTQDMCSSAGLEGYEVSNHARGNAARSAHNGLYWSGGDWIGVGPGAHGRLGYHVSGGRLATEAAARPGDYCQAVKEVGCGYEGGATLSAHEEAAERILMGLRVVDGLDRKALRELTGLDVQTTAARKFAGDDLIVLTDDRVSLTPPGRLFADRIAGELVPQAED